MADSNPLNLPVVVLSHRGPASFASAPDGERTITRGAGGLVTALMGLAEHLDDAVWVCAASGSEDAAVAREHGGGAVELALWPEPRLVENDSEPDTATLRVRYVEVDEKAHDD